MRMIALIMNELGPKAERSGFERLSDPRFRALVIRLHHLTVILLLLLAGLGSMSWAEQCKGIT